MTVGREEMLAGRARFDVVGIGNALVDVIAHADDVFLAEHGLVKGWMDLIDTDRAVHLYQALGSAVEMSGGSAANTMCGIASFGGRAAYIGKVNADELGTVFGHDLLAVGVQFPFARPGLVNNFRSFMLSHEDGGSTWAYWKPERAKRLFAEASAIVDEEARDRRLREINRELYEEYWAMPIVLRHTPFAASAKVADWQPSNGSPTALAFETLKPAPTK